ncbi:hypothetical protein L3Q82_021372 [Scortum barcoo]|uniref:Uncharacterized protein n=1 Tax=Scortum barcoo TaxID=214431 RepID=A0ACB8X4K5_9TELE|nr:hypothetical protein L3Q82_021372 [Scortum barcoo]
MLKIRKHKGVHQCTWHQDTLGRRSMIDFVVVSSDLRPYVLDTRVKRGAELSTDHHLVGGLQLPPPEESFSQIPREAGDIESPVSGPCSLPPLSTAAMFEVVDARSLVPVVAATPKPVWWTPEVRDAVRLEEGVLSDHSMLACGTPDAEARLTGGPDRRVCSNYRGITLLSLPRKVSRQGTGERIWRPIVDPRIQEEQCGFRPGRGTLDQLYTLHRVLEGLWEFAQPVHMCFVDLEKAFDRVPRGILWGCSASMGSGRAFAKGCSVSVRPEQELGSHCRQGRRESGFGNHRISSLLFADDVVLMASSGQDLQHVLERFAAECEAAGMRISTSKSEAMVLDRKRVACPLQVGGEVLPQVEEFKYLGVLFTSEGKIEREIDRRIGAASAVSYAVGVPDWTVVVKKELSRKA